MATHLRNSPRCEPILIERDKMVDFVEGDKMAILVEKYDDFATQIIPLDCKTSTISIMENALFQFYSKSRCSEFIKSVRAVSKCDNIIIN